MLKSTREFFVWLYSYEAQKDPFVFFLVIWLSLFIFFSILALISVIGTYIWSVAPYYILIAIPVFVFIFLIYYSIASFRTRK